MENYKELYALSKEVFKEELERFQNLEQKASAYMSVLTLLLGVAGFFINWLLENFLPPRNGLDVALLILAAGILASLLTAWFSVFSVLKSYKVNVIPLNPEIIDFFVKNRMIDIYYHLSVQMAKNGRENRILLNRKGRGLHLAYSAMRVSLICLIIFGMLFGFYKWREQKPLRMDVNFNVTIK